MTRPRSDTRTKAEKTENKRKGKEKDESNTEKQGTKEHARSGAIDIIGNVDAESAKISRLAKLSVLSYVNLSVL